MVQMIRLLDRKEELVKHLREYNNQAEVRAKEGGGARANGGRKGGPKTTASLTAKAFQKEYAWLVINIETTNRALEQVQDRLRTLAPVVAEAIAEVSSRIRSSVCQIVPIPILSLILLRHPPSHSRLAAPHILSHTRASTLDPGLSTTLGIEFHLSWPSETGAAHPSGWLRLWQRVWLAS